MLSDRSLLKPNVSLFNKNELIFIFLPLSPPPPLHYREFLYLTVMDHNNITEDTEIGCAKLPLVDIPSQDYVGYFDIYDQNNNKVGVVDLAVRLERIALPFGVSASMPATPTFEPTPLSPPVHAPAATSNGSLYPQQQYKQQLQQQHQQHRQQGAGFSSIAAPSSPSMPPQPFYLQQSQQQQQQQQQAFSSPTTVYAPRPVVMASPVPAMYYPSSSNGPTPSLFAASVAPYSSPSMTPQQHQEELDERVPDRLAYASTPGRPFTPLPYDFLLSPSPYHDGPGYSTPTSTAPFSPYRHEQQQQQQQQQRYVLSPVPMPLCVEGRSSSYSSSSPTSNENGQTRAEEEENDGSALPPYWEERRMPDGRIFYLDHRHKVTTWTRPLAMGVVPEYTA